MQGPGVLGTALLSDSPDCCPLLQTLETAGYVKSVLVSTTQHRLSPHPVCASCLGPCLGLRLLPGQTKVVSQRRVDVVSAVLPARGFAW